MIINSEKVFEALNKYLSQKEQMYFESNTGEPITSFIDILFNMVIFDMEKFEKYLNGNPNYFNYSMSNWLIRAYGKEFQQFFKNKIISNPFYKIGVIE